jgi:type IV secretory pathway VirB4 component
MVKTKKDIRAIHFDSIFLILILFFGLQICQNTDFNKSVPNGKPVPIEISINQSNATISSGIQFYFFQKCWISNKDNFRLLTFEQTKYLDNKKVDQKISLLDKIRKKTPGFLILIIQNLLFRPENSEVPVLS